MPFSPGERSEFEREIADDILGYAARALLPGPDPHRVINGAA
jgi:hypothetical protein